MQVPLTMYYAYSACISFITTLQLLNTIHEIDTAIIMLYSINTFNECELQLLYYYFNYCIYLEAAAPALSSPYAGRRHHSR